jgi:benzoyl-CoA reductase/2-hydroxyglutaryl-CoA dehydratase subunit BcrC/BadD/HgdB
MTTVAYCHPLVPPEWIAAHRLQPQWLQPERSHAAARGACAYAGSVVEAATTGGLPAAALVLTTVCDPMRYAAAVIDRHGRQPVFLFNVPSTWQTPVAGQIYLGELRRLGKFLVQLGGKSPSADELIHQMQAFEAARSALLAAQDHLSARQLAEGMLCVRGNPADCIVSPPAPVSQAAQGGIPLAIVGGPLVEEDFDLFDLIDRLGGRVVLDATEGGTRLLPAAFDPLRMAADPLAELARAYFAAALDVFRRPNDPLFAWLERQLAERRVRGVLFRHYVWCDLWHAELYRFRACCPVPVLEIDVHHDDHGAGARIAGRVEAFLEMLR